MPRMTSTNTYALKQLAEELTEHADTILEAIAEIERLERQVKRLQEQVEELGGTPDPGV